MAKKPEGSRIPSAVGAIPVVGDLMKSADSQARWMQEMLEQNARLVGQFPATMKTFNDSIERFNQTIGRLDRAVTSIETATKNLTGPMEKVLGSIDPKALREIPEVLDALRKEAVPAMRAATDTQRQVAMLQSTIERVLTVLGELPGAGMLRRLTTGRDGDGDAAPGHPKPEKPRNAR
jgi:ABC-type transporter Mla subunit MlaD